MKRKGGLDDFKLYYERLPSEPTPKKRAKNISKSKNNVAKEFMDNHFLLGLAIHFPIIFQSRKVPHRSAILHNIDDRKTMPKVPPSNKKRTTKSSRQKVV